MNTFNTDILIIGAGPSGSSAAALLHKQGYHVTVIEKQYFPRFSIGESLLPQAMVFLEEADLLDAVSKKASENAFQYKNGASFLKGSDKNYYDFREKFTAGPGETWQVRRANFDHILIDEVQSRGVDVRFGEEVVSVDVEREAPLIVVKRDNGEEYTIQCRFLLDASGFGRVLPKKLDLESPSSFPIRRAVFTHIEDGIKEDNENFDRNKILITVHEKDSRAWYWLIPFADGRASFGVVAEESFFNQYGYKDSLDKDDLSMLLKRILSDDPALSHVLKDAVFDTDVRTLIGYAADVKHLAQRNYALLGNAGEFLDPVFSSGITIALKSSSLVVPLVHKALSGQRVDWLNEYEKPLRKGIQVFKAYVEAWYTGELQTVIFSDYKKQNKEIREMISSLLAGYAWDDTNPIHKNAEHRLKTLAEHCRIEGKG